MDNLKLYLKLVQDKKSLFTNDYLEVFTDIKLLEEYQEQYHVRLGVLYKSNYHMMVVDLLRDKEGKLFTYERVIPTSLSNGVVIVPIYNDKFILLKQYRHAIQRVQYCFPRGFGEVDLSDEENASKELLEELGSSFVDLAFLGNVCSNSGLEASTTLVYQGAITKPQVEVGNEDIIEYIEVSLDELNNMIKEGMIDDSFTLSAMSLYNNKLK